MSTPPIRIALIGCGYITQAEHVPALLTAQPEVAVAATVDPDPDRARAVAAPFGAPSFATLDDALRGAAFDAVLMATPPRSHAALIAQAAAAGRHILVEKPVAYSLAEARAAVAAVAASGVRCLVGYHRRYDDDCREARRLLAEGAIGAPRAAVSQCRLAFPSVYRAYAAAEKAPPDPALAPQDLGPDWLAENSIHHINLLRFWLGEVTAVHGAVYRAADHNLGIVTLSFGTVLASHHQLRGMECGETISVYGEAGALHLDLWYPHRPYAFPRLTLFDRAGQTRREILRPRASPYTNQLLAFARHLRGKGGNDSPLSDSVRDLDVLVEIRRVAHYTQDS
ncbi:MAG: Gfo/Idh/MocA family oxidoreductase [Alphaproteobacteria bacterium]|nr:Gfo/Idh/MocA family oxidoreductase [Alphaproteobacteria bacterium]